MKKILALVLMLLMAVSVTGCGGGGETETETKTSAVEKIGYLGYLNSNEQQFTGYIKQIIGNYSITVPKPYEAKFFDNLSSMQMALEAGQIDEIAVVLPVARYMVARNDNMQILEGHPMGNPNMTDMQGTVTEFANDFCFALTSENVVLRDAVEVVITEMKNDGTLENLVRTYITDAKPADDPVAVEFEKFDGAESIKVAVTGDLPPMDLVTADGKAAGFNTAFLAEIGKRLQRNIEVIDIDSAARAAALTSGQADISFWTVVPISQVIPADADKPAGIELTSPYYRGATVHVALKK